MLKHFIPHFAVDQHQIFINKLVKLGQQPADWKKEWK